MTVLDAFDCSVGDDGELAERIDRPQGEIAAAIGCSQMRVSRIIRMSLERLSAHASMACGGWSMSDATEGTTA